MKNDVFLPVEQVYGSFTQGGQYQFYDYNFGVQTGEDGTGDYSVNVGRNFLFSKNFILKTRFGQLNEEETWLGNSSDGILAVGSHNITNFGNIGVIYKLGRNEFSAEYTKGHSYINTTNNSIIKKFSDIRIAAHRFTYKFNKNEHDTFGWTFSIPSYIKSGTMNLEVAESVNSDGTINYTAIKSDLRANTKEKDIGFFYSCALGNDLNTKFNFSAEYRKDIAGVHNKNDLKFNLKYVKSF
jgi:hypothetical protein